MTRHLLVLQVPVEQLRAGLGIPDTVVLAEVYQERPDRLTGTVNVVLEHPSFARTWPGAGSLPKTRFIEEVMRLVEEYKEIVDGD